MRKYLSYLVVEFEASKKVTIPLNPVGKFLTKQMGLKFHLQNLYLSKWEQLEVNNSVTSTCIWEEISLFTKVLHGKVFHILNINAKRQPFQLELLSFYKHEILISLSHILMPYASEFSHETHLLTYLSTTLKYVSIHINSITYIYLLCYTTFTCFKCAVLPTGG